MILQKLRHAYDGMGPTYRRIAEYIAENYHDVAFMSGAELARVCDVHESVVVKFAISLGYSGSPDMLREIQSATLGSMEPGARRADDTNPRFARYRSLFLANASLLQRAACGEGDAFVRLVRAALGAEKIYTVGFWKERSLATFATFQFDLLGKAADAVTDAGQDLQQALHGVRPKDLVICFHFAPYLADIGRAVDMAAAGGARCAVVTDREGAPATERADIVLALDPKGEAGGVGYHVMATSVVSACTTALSLLAPDEALASLEQLDDILAKYQIHIPED